MKAKHHIIAGFLLTILMIHTLVISLLYGFYMIDRPVFIELFCVNQDKPEMHCDGSCMLVKMDKAHHHDSDEPVIPDYMQVQLVFYFETTSFDLHKITTSKTISIFYYQNLYKFDNMANLFRPPILV